MINIENRKVGKIDAISVMNDYEVIELRFRLRNKLTELLNLTDCNAVWINYQNGTAKDRYNVGTIAVDGDYCEFSWILGKNATKSAGKTYFVICAQRTNGATVLQEWNSILTSFSVEKGLEVLRTDSEPYSDIFAQLTEKIDKKVETIVAGTNIEVEREGGTVTISAQGGGSVFTVEYTVQQGVATCNKTFSEIYNAYQAGAVIRAVASDSVVLELAFVSETEIVFRSMETAVQYEIFHTSDNSIEVGTVALQKHLTAGARIRIGTDYVISADVTGLATETALGNEATARQNADNNLQSQIDAITVSSDVVDIVGTYQELLDYPTTGLYANSVIKVLQDSTHNNALSYYRWVIEQNVGSWVYVGSEGPFYTKGETNSLLTAYVTIFQGVSQVKKVLAVNEEGNAVPTELQTLTGRAQIDLSSGTSAIPFNIYLLDSGIYDVVSGGYLGEYEEGNLVANHKLKVDTGSILILNQYATTPTVYLVSAGIPHLITLSNKAWNQYHLITVDAVAARINDLATLIAQTYLTSETAQTTYQPKNRYITGTTVALADWEEEQTPTYADYPYKATIAIQNVTPNSWAYIVWGSDIPEVYPNGNTVQGGIEIFASEPVAIIIPTIKIEG